MGFRSLIEIDHDDTNKIMLNSAQFAQDLDRYVASGCARSRIALEQYNVNVVAMRHSSDKYIVTSRSSGFPSQLPYQDFQQHIAMRVREAKAMTEVKGNTKADLELIVASLVDIVERLKNGEDTVS